MPENLVVPSTSVYVGLDMANLPKCHSVNGDFVFVYMGGGPALLSEISLLTTRDFA